MQRKTDKAFRSKEYIDRFSQSGEIKDFYKYLNHLWRVGEMSYEEYSYIYSVLLKHCPCNLLVFGTGYDSYFWDSVNSGGTTIFMENKCKWSRKIRGRYPHLQIVDVKYRTRILQCQSLLDEFMQGDKEALRLDVPDYIEKTPWDLILVDAPKNKVGRMKSIYMASILIRDGGSVFLHDYARGVETLYAETFLGVSIHKVHKLAHHEKEKS